MKILNAIKAFGRELRQTSTTSQPEQWFIDFVNGGVSSVSGVVVNEHTALTYSPFWAGVRILSGGVSALPFPTFRKVAGGKEIVDNAPTMRLLNLEANPFIDSMTFRETLEAQAVTYGNGFANIERDGAGRPIGLWPLLPNTVQRVVGENGDPFYELTLPNGEKRGLLDRDVLHIHGLGFDGLSGYNVVRMQKDALGLGMATKRYGAAFFGNNADPGGVITHPNKMSEGAQKRWKKSWKDMHQGVEKSHLIAIMEEGMTYTRIGVSPEDAQAIETQKFSVDDVARILNIPPHMLASMERATFSNIEQQSLDFLKQTLFYWLRKWEIECNRKLIMPSQQGTVFVEHKIEAFLRGDIKARYDSYKLGKEGGWLNTNEIRAFENMNSVGPEGDVYVTVSNSNDADVVDDDASDDDVRNLYRNTWATLLTKESKAIGRLIKHPDTLLVKAESFYADHARHICRVIEPLLRSQLGLTPAHFMANKIAEEYTVSAMDQLGEWFRRDTNITVPLSTWEHNAPQLMADIMITGANNGKPH